MELAALKHELEKERRLRKNIEDKLEALEKILEAKKDEFEAYGLKVAKVLAKKEAIEKELRSEIEQLKNTNGPNFNKREF